MESSERRAALELFIIAKMTDQLFINCELGSPFQGSVDKLDD